MKSALLISFWLQASLEGSVTPSSPEGWHAGTEDLNLAGTFFSFFFTCCIISLLCLAYFMAGLFIISEVSLFSLGDVSDFQKSQNFDFVGQISRRRPRHLSLMSSLLQSKLMAGQAESSQAKRPGGCTPFPAADRSECKGQYRPLALGQQVGIDSEQPPR